MTKKSRDRRKALRLLKHSESFSLGKSTLRWSEPFVVLTEEQQLKCDELIDYANKILKRQ